MKTIKEVLAVEKMDFLISLYIFSIVVTELMGGKTVLLPTIFGFHLAASVAIFFVPFVYTVNDSVIEVFGFQRARSLARSGILMVSGVFLFSLLAISLPSSQRFAPMAKSYNQIFGISARIAFASLTAFSIAEVVDILVFNKMREKMKGKSLWFRNSVSNLVAESFDTTIFMILAFYALNKPMQENILFLLGLIIPYWLLKSVMGILETPLVYICVSWLRSNK